MEKSFDIEQRIFHARHHPSISVEVYHENSLTRKALDSFSMSIRDGIIGVAPAYGSKCALTSIALSSQRQVIVIRISASKASKKSQNPGKVSLGRTLLQESLLDPSKRKHAFKMDKLAAALYTDVSLRISNAVDLLSVAKDNRHSLSSLMFVLGGEVTLNKANVSKLLEQEERDSGNISETALQAWVACQAAFLDRTSKLLAKSAQINTHMLDETHLAVLAKFIRDAHRLNAQKPTKQKNEVEKTYSHKHDKLELTSTRFKTRIMFSPGSTQRIEIKTMGQQGEKRISAKVTKVNGRGASLLLQGNLSGAVRSVTTVGRESLTTAEAAREEITLRALQRTNNITTHPFVQRIWLPAEKTSWINTSSSSILIGLNFPSPRTLNASQTKAVKNILSNNDIDRITLIHGPPGTGKTTVIAAAVTSIMASTDRTRTLWIVAQSNVAVKNVAEKLVDVGFLAFRILVSKDFHFDWHEHLYHQIEAKVIRSDDFQDDIVATERLLLDSRVILCTLSMLSHRKLPPFTRLVPIQTMIFDEASQIEIGDYLPPLQRFQSTLRKLVFIGDDKQLAPYGQGDIPELCSIFEMPHLRNGAVFLDTQYRMPTPIGDFISRKVYGSRLKSVHLIKAMSSCTFVDVATGQEEKSGHSWMNTREVTIAISLAKTFNALGKSYRIITPYDAQRSRLENALKAANMPWEDRCFNVDSFQGNEADYIILSLVRSQKTGFMKDHRRTNVMLTRCKKGMVILTSRRFIEGVASSTLVGGLAKAWGAKALSWVEAGLVLNGTFRPPT